MAFQEHHTYQANEPYCPTEVVCCDYLCVSEEQNGLAPIHSMSIAEISSESKRFGNSWLQPSGYILSYMQT